MVKGVRGSIAYLLTQLNGLRKVRLALGDHRLLTSSFSYCYYSFPRLRISGSQLRNAELLIVLSISTLGAYRVTRCHWRSESMCDSHRSRTLNPTSASARHHAIK
jgi:hypothetical protein